MEANTAVQVATDDLQILTPGPTAAGDPTVGPLFLVRGSFTLPAFEHLPLTLSRINRRPSFRLANGPSMKITCYVQGGDPYGNDAYGETRWDVATGTWFALFTAGTVVPGTYPVIAELWSDSSVLVTATLPNLTVDDDTPAVAPNALTAGETRTTAFDEEGTCTAGHDVKCCLYLGASIVQAATIAQTGGTWTASFNALPANTGYTFLVELWDADHLVAAWSADNLTVA